MDGLRLKSYPATSDKNLVFRYIVTIPRGLWSILKPEDINLYPVMDAITAINWFTLQIKTTKRESLREIICHFRTLMTINVTKFYVFYTLIKYQQEIGRRHSVITKLLSFVYICFK